MGRTIAATVALVAAVVAALAWLLVSSFPDDSSHGYRVVLRPARPLTLHQCVTELHRLKSGFGTQACQAGHGHPWFRLTLTNVSDSLGSPVCQATAYDHQGHKLFDDELEFGIVSFPGGPPVPKGNTFRLTWYVLVRGPASHVETPGWTPGMIDHYTASCHGRPQSEVPI